MLQLVFIDLKRREETRREREREREREKNLSEESLRKLLLPFCSLCVCETIAPMIPRKKTEKIERKGWGRGRLN